MTFHHSIEQSSPLISVICPVFNKQDYLQATIQSVVNQIYPHWELILIDDGSTDFSKSLAEEAAKAHQQVVFLQRIFTHPNTRGASVCRNIGIEAAQGDWVVFLDADDVLQPFALSQRVSQLQQFPACNMLVFQEAYFYKDGAPWLTKDRIEQLHKRSLRKSKDATEWALKKFLSYDLPWTISNPIWSLEFLKNNQGFTPDFQRLQDPEMHVRALLNPTLKWQYLKGAMPADVGIRLDPERTQQTTFERIDKQQKAVLYFIEFFMNYLKELNQLTALPHLKGYLFAIEYDIRIHQKELKDKEFQKLLSPLQSLKTSLKPGYAYRFLMSAAVFLYQYPWLRKAKLSSLFYRLYYC